MSDKEKIIYAGKSKSRDNPRGIRRKDRRTGEALAPRSFRKVWKKRRRALLSDCLKGDLKRAQILEPEEE